MMKQTPLEIGSCIFVNNIKYLIDEVLGFGANCLVYLAHFTDSKGYSKNIVLKECYPATASIERNGDNIVWNNQQEKDDAFAKMEESYHFLSQIQSSNISSSSKVYALDLFEYNGTLYIATIPNTGVSYDKDTSTDIKDIVLTTLALCNMISQYHKTGYLHLDIKPSNFISVPDNTGNGKNIVLFDVDTIVKMDEIDNRKIKSVSYSDGWSAPEQKLQQIGKICASTDIYSVGAVLFERIMNRPVKNADNSPFATWEFDERFDIKNVNPKVQRLLTQVFHKSLSANPKRRYQTAEEMVTALHEIVEILTVGSVYVVSSYPVNTCQFVGRNEELEQVESKLSKCHKVFLNGAGGIGKTELAKQYIALHKNEYDAIVFIRYESSIIEALNTVPINGFAGSAEEKYFTLKELADEHLLIVLDSFDVDVTSEPDFEKLLELNCDCIITTRTDFSEIYPDLAFIKLQGLPDAELIKIFENESNFKLSEQDYSILAPVIPYGKECTYFWSFLAKHVKGGEYSVEEIVENVLYGLDNFEDSENVLDTKDGQRIKTNVLMAMCRLFRLHKFSGFEIEVLKTIYFMQALGLNKNKFRECLKHSKKDISTASIMNALNDLVEKGYILLSDDGQLSIHDVLRAVIDYEIKPLLSDSIIVNNYLFIHVFRDRGVISEIEYDDEISKDVMVHLFECLFSVFFSTNWNYVKNAEYCVDFLYRMVGGKETNIDYIFNKYTNLIISFISLTIHNQKVNNDVRIKAIIILITYCCYFTKHGFEPVEEKHIKNAEMAEKLFFKVINQNDLTTLDAALINVLCEPLITVISNDWAICKCFSAELIDAIIKINPNDIVNTPAWSNHNFNVRVFANQEYEKLYLKEALKTIHSIQEQEQEHFAYISVGRILMAAHHVSVDIDEELRSLRREIYEYCTDKFSQETICAIDTSEFVNETISVPATLTIGQGLSRFQSSLLPPEDKEKNNVFDRFDDYNDFLLNDTDEIQLYFLNKSAKNDRITEKDLETFAQKIKNSEYNDFYDDCIMALLSIVDSFRHQNVLENYAKQLIDIATIIEDEMDNCTFPIWQIMDEEYVQAEIDSLKTILYDSCDDVENAQIHFSEVLYYCRYHLYQMEEEDIIHFGFASCMTVPVDRPAWIAINRVKNHLAIDFLIQYTEIVKEVLDVDSDEDERMYCYYKKIVEMAEKKANAFRQSLKIVDTLNLDLDDIVNNALSNNESVEGNSDECNLKHELESTGNSSIFTELFQESIDEYETIIKKYRSLMNNISGIV